MLVPSGAIFAIYMQGCVEKFQNGQFQISETDGRLIVTDLPTKIANLPLLEFYEINTGFRDAPANFRLKAESLIRSDGLLVNSFLELEERVIKDFQSSRPKVFFLMPSPRPYDESCLHFVDILGIL
jgi:hypothetical protein